MQKYILDTHTFIWAVNKSPNLSKKAKEILENAENEIVVSIASIWEIAIKVSIGKLQPSKSFEDFIEKERKIAQINLLPISIESIKKNAELPFVKIPKTNKTHNDPFDRMIICQAITENIPLISIDDMLPLYPDVKVIW